MQACYCTPTASDQFVTNCGAKCRLLRIYVSEAMNRVCRRRKIQDSRRVMDLHRCTGDPDTDPLGWTLAHVGSGVAADSPRGWMG